jgi:thiol-disulfide isomerase/thioredoxin
MSSAEPIAVTYVTAPRCGFCERGREVLADLADILPLEVREVTLDSPEGRALAARWRVPYPPLLLVDGQLLGYGRLSAKRLRRLLADHAVAAGPRT